MRQHRGQAPCTGLSSGINPVRYQSQRHSFPWEVKPFRNRHFCAYTQLFISPFPVMLSQFSLGRKTQPDKTAWGSFRAEAKKHSHVKFRVTVNGSTQSPNSLEHTYFEENVPHFGKGFDVSEITSQRFANVLTGAGTSAYLSTLVDSHSYWKECGTRGSLKERERVHLSIP